MNDHNAWRKFPHHRKWFNKLWLAQTLGYHCGPCGTLPESELDCVVRPTYNLSGMGVGAKRITLSPTTHSEVPAGYFWSEYFIGEHISVDMRWDGFTFRPTSAYKATKDNLQFTMWERINHHILNPTLHPSIKQLFDVQEINIEMISGKIIEVHLRTSPDPKYKQLIPVFKDSIKDCPAGYKWVSAYDDADQLLDNPRLGFYVK